MVGTELEISRTTQNGIATLCCKGEIYVCTEKSFQDHLEALIAEGHGAIGIDLTKVNFLSSSFFNTVAKAKRKHPHIEITCLTTPEHDRLFSIVQFDKVVATTRAFATS